MAEEPIKPEQPKKPETPSKPKTQKPQRAPKPKPPTVSEGKIAQTTKFKPKEEPYAIKPSSPEEAQTIEAEDRAFQAKLEKFKNRPKQEKPVEEHKPITIRQLPYKYSNDPAVQAQWELSGGPTGIPIDAKKAIANITNIIDDARAYGDEANANWWGEVLQVVKQQSSPVSSMSDDEWVFRQAIRMGDEAAIGPYTDWLEEQGRNKEAQDLRSRAMVEGTQAIDATPADIEHVRQEALKLPFTQEDELRAQYFAEHGYLADDVVSRMIKNDLRRMTYHKDSEHTYQEMVRDAAIAIRAMKIQAGTVGQ